MFDMNEQKMEDFQSLMKEDGKARKRRESKRRRRRGRRGSGGVMEENQEENKSFKRGKENIKNKQKYVNIKRTKPKIFKILKLRGK